MEADDMVEKMIKQLKEDIKSLQGEMEKALGLKEYAMRLQEINEVMGSVRDLLNENERAITDLLVQAYELTQAGLEKAVIIVNVIKSQCHILFCVLQTLPETTEEKKKDKLHATCKCFADFATVVEEDVQEAESKLFEASNILFKAKTQLATINSTLKKSKIVLW